MVAEGGIGDDSAVAALRFCMQFHIGPSLPKQAHRGYVRFQLKAGFWGS